MQGWTVDHIDEIIIELKQVWNVKVPFWPTSGLPVSLHVHLCAGPRGPSPLELLWTQHSFHHNKTLSQKAGLLRVDTRRRVILACEGGPRPQRLGRAPQQHCLAVVAPRRRRQLETPQLLQVLCLYASVVALAQLACR